MLSFLSTFLKFSEVGQIIVGAQCCLAQQLFDRKFPHFLPPDHFTFGQPLRMEMARLHISRHLSRCLKMAA